MFHLLGVSWLTVICAFATVRIHYVKQYTFQTCEELVGKSSKKVAEKKTKDPLDLKIKMITEALYVTYHTEEHGDLPVLKFSTYASCQKHFSGRCYESTSSAVHMVGVHYDKIYGSCLINNGY